MDRCYLSESVEVLWCGIELLRGTQDVKEVQRRRKRKRREEGKERERRQWMRENEVKR